MKSPRRPFWIYSSTYYILAIAVCIATFFVMWGLLLGEDQTPWIPAGVVASLVLICAVVLREVILRNHYQRAISAQRQFDQNLNRVFRQPRGLPSRDSSKISLQKNAEILKQIADKSKAAMNLQKTPDGHLEVFELCNEYLRLNEREMERIGIDATKLAVFRKGRERVQSFHKFHLLSWASLESNLLIKDAKIRVSVSDKLETAQRALGVLDSARQYYPDETQVIDSIDVVNEFIVSVRVSHWVEQAERAAYKENYQRAISHYRDALFFLAKENERTSDRDLAANKINIEIEKLRELLRNDENSKLPPTKNINS